METWEQVLWSSSPAFPGSFARPSVEYILTDFRIMVRRRGRVLQELALDDVSGVRLTQSWCERLAGTSTVRINSRRHDSAVALCGISQGPQIALVLQLLSADRVGTDVDHAFIARALAPGSPPLLHSHVGPRLLLFATLAFILAFAVMGLTRRNSLAPIIYAADDPKAGAVHSVLQVLNNPKLNRQMTVTSGVLAERASEMLQAFFRSKRQKGE